MHMRKADKVTSEGDNLGQSKVMEAMPILPEPKKTTKYTTPEPPEFEPNPNEYHVVSLDVRGGEIKGSDFSATHKAVKGVFSDEKKFKVKKNPQNK